LVATCGHRLQPAIGAHRKPLDDPSSPSIPPRNPPAGIERPKRADRIVASGCLRIKLYVDENFP
jgi:hypothetical protein